MQLIIVHRFLENIVFPPLNAMLVLLLGIIVLRRYYKIGFTFIIISLVLFYLQSIPLMAYLINKAYELPPLTASELTHSQAIVVLGGGVNDDDFEYTTGLTLGSGTLIRVSYAAYLAKQYPQKLIVTSAGYGEAELMRRALIDMFNVHNPIITEDKSRNTDENAQFVARILQQQHIDKVVVVTQAYHMRRAMMLFRKYGLQPMAGSTDYYPNTIYNVVLALEPSARAVRQVAQIDHEVLGYWFYK